MAKIPDEVHFEVFEKYADGTLRDFPTGSTPYLRQESAAWQAEIWTAEAASRYRSESRGPVKPKEPSTYVVVRRTLIREEV